MTTTNTTYTITRTSEGWTARWSDQHGAHKLPLDVADNATDAQIVAEATRLIVEDQPMNDAEIAALRNSIQVVR